MAKFATILATNSGYRTVNIVLLWQQVETFRLSTPAHLINKVILTSSNNLRNNLLFWMKQVLKDLDFSSSQSHPMNQTEVDVDQTEDEQISCHPQKLSPRPEEFMSATDTRGMSATFQSSNLFYKPNWSYELYEVTKYSLSKRGHSRVTNYNLIKTQF